MFAMTGAYFSLFFVVYGALVVGALGGDAEELRSFFPGIERPAYEASGVAAPPLPFDTLFARLPSHWPRIDLVAMEIEGWGDAAGTVFMEGHVPGTLGRSAAVVLNVSTGEVLASRDPEDTPPMTATAVGLVTLHFTRFGGAALKAMFFLLALATSAVILTGKPLMDRGAATRRRRGHAMAPPDPGQADRGRRSGSRRGSAGSLSRDAAGSRRFSGTDAG